MKASNLSCLIFLALVVVLGPGANLFAADTIVNNTAALRNAINAAQPGDRILMAPGTYDYLYVDGTTGGTLAKPITIAAQNPLNPPLFNQGLMFYGVSNIVLDGLSVNAVVGSGNGIQFALGQNLVLKNVKSAIVDMTDGNNDIKFSGCTNYLMYNVTASQWGSCGVDMVGSAKGLLMNSNFSNSGNPGSYCALQAKGGAFGIGVYNNVITNVGQQALQMGGATGAPYFAQGNLALGWECYDSAAMGNKIIGGLYPIAYVNANNVHFEYNTIVGPSNALLRILSESDVATNPSSNGVYSHNLVQYGNVGETWNYSSNINAGSFKFDGNYWYKTTNPSASIPAMPGTQTNNAGGVNPQLNASYDPQYAPAKAYGADAAGKKAAWLQEVGGFQWSWDVAQSYVPFAHPAVTAIANGVKLDGTASTPGVNSYGNNTITSYSWDMNNDGVADITGAGVINLTTAQLMNTYGLPAGTHTVDLSIGAVNELGTLVWSDPVATTLTVAPEPLTMALLCVGGLTLLRRKP